jgi:transposase
MCLRPQAVPEIPAETARVARAAFPKGHPYLKMRDEFGSLYQDLLFADLFPTRGQPAAAPWRLALITLLQFAEGLSDRQAADAVRSRIDWKYLLALPLDDPGFDHTVLSEFRTRLVDKKVEELLLDQLLARLRERGWLKPQGRQRTDSTHVLAGVRLLNRLALVGETFRHLLNTLAEAAPGWLRQQCLPEWVERYGRSFDEGRLPAGEAERQQLALTIGIDGFRLVARLDADPALAALRQLPAGVTLRQVWIQQYWREGEQIRFRSEADGLAAGVVRIQSPYDPQARASQKRTTLWVGYKVHLTETCEPDTPWLFTQVSTTSAVLRDSDAVADIHARLKQRQLLPPIHLVDGGYVDAAELVRSAQKDGVELLGPAPADTSWQAQAGQGFAAADFAFDWEQQIAWCPRGKPSQRWREKRARGETLIEVSFAPADCRGCPSGSQCRKHDRERRVVVRPQTEQTALQAARARQKTAEFAAAYAARAGIEGSLSQGVRRCRLRRSRYVGMARVHLGHVLTAAGLNFLRAGQWLLDTPRARTRRCAFLRAMAPA